MAVCCSGYYTYRTESGQSLLLLHQLTLEEILRRTGRERQEKGKEESRRNAVAFQDFLTQYFAVRTSKKIQELIGGAITSSMCLILAFLAKVIAGVCPLITNILLFFLSYLFSLMTFA